jgi:hypothetical protein
VPATTTAGRASVALRGVAGFGDVRILLENPGVPTPFALDVETQHRPADGSSLISVASGELSDRFGNRMLDGIAATVIARYPDGSTSTQAVTILGGTARAAIEAPNAPGIVRVEMIVRGTVSRTLDVTFGAGR